MPSRNGEATWSPAARSAPKPGVIPAARPRTSTRSRRAHRKIGLVGRQSQASRPSIPESAMTISSRMREGKQLFAQDLYGGADPKYRIKTRVYTELAWHSLFIRTLLIRPERAELESFVPELTIVDLPSFKADREAPRRAAKVRNDGRDRLHPQDRADLRLVLRRRDEEVGVHHAQFLSARAGRDADALLGQCRPGGRRRAVLRPVRHRQDHALGRSEPHADRRRRDMAGVRTASSISKAAATPRPSSCRREAEPEIYAATQPLRRGAGKRRVRSRSRA